MKNLRTQAELKALVKSLDDQNFGYIKDWELLERKFSSIVRDQNKFNLRIEPLCIANELGFRKMETFKEMEIAAKKYFAKFSPKDKIFECINNCGIDTYKEFRIFKSDNPQQIDEFNKAMKPFNLTYDEAVLFENNGFYLSDFTKDFIKVRWNDGGCLTYLIQEVLGCTDFSFNKWDNDKIGKSFTLEGLQITFYQNGYAKIKSPKIDKLKKLYIEAYKKYKSHYFLTK